jgi:hypothetical protein
MASDGHRRGTRGQSTPFFLCFLVVMLMFVGLVVNVGQAVNRRIALQIAADAGAWTGATNMAIGMNALADVNQWRRRIEPLISIVLPILGPFGLSELPIKAWEVFTIALNLADTAIQTGYTKIPYDHAALVTWYNTQDLFPGEQLRWYEGFRTNLIAGGSDKISNEMPFAKSRPTVCTEQPFGKGSILAWPCLADEEPIRDSQLYFAPCLVPPLFECPNWYDYIQWWQKSDLDILFVWVVEAPAARPIYNPFGLFGEDAIPVMRAASAAKPVGGNIEDGESDYRVKFTPLTKASMIFAPETLLFGGVYDDTVDKWRPIVY